MASRAAGEYPDVPARLAAPGIDSHTHLDICTGVRLPLKAGEVIAEDVVPGEDEQFPPLSFFYESAMAAGIERVVQIGCNLPAARWTADIVASEAEAGRPWLLGGVALHPNEAPTLARAGQLDEALAEIDELAGRERVRVVGETGLDYFRTDASDSADMDAQKESFRAHVEIAKRRGLALQIHDREAHQDVLDILAEVGAPDVTILHCFSGDVDMAEECARRGYFMSFAGNITFKNAAGLREAAAVVPDELLLTETDAPFLTPHPHRGKPGGPYLAALNARKLAEVRGVSEEHIANTTTANALRAIGEWA